MWLLCTAACLQVCAQPPHLPRKRGHHVPGRNGQADRGVCGGFRTHLARHPPVPGALGRVFLLDVLAGPVFELHRHRCAARLWVASSMETRGMQADPGQQQDVQSNGVVLFAGRWRTTSTTLRRCSMSRGNPEAANCICMPCMARG